MKPRGPKESQVVAIAGARLVAGYAWPCLEARSCAQSGTQPGAWTMHNLLDTRVPVRPQFFSRL